MSFQCALLAAGRGARGLAVPGLCGSLELLRLRLGHFRWLGRTPRRAMCFSVLAGAESMWLRPSRDLPTSYLPLSPPCFLFCVLFLFVFVCWSVVVSCVCVSLFVVPLVPSLSRSLSRPLSLNDALMPVLVSVGSWACSTPL